MRILWIFRSIALMLVISLLTTFLLPTDGDMTVTWLVRISCGLAVFLLIVFYSKVIKPFRSITNGLDLLRAQDFSSRLTHVHQTEADRIIDMFNRMMTSLKNERLRLREQNHFLDLLIDVSPMGIIILYDCDRIWFV